MANFNKVILMGNLTRNPEKKAFPSGTAIVEFGLAVNRTWRDSGTGEKREATTFVDCKAMGRTGELIEQYMEKGRPIFIEGRLDYRSWDAKDGSGKRSKLEVFVEGFQFLGGRQSDQGGGSGNRYDEPRTGGMAVGAGGQQAQDAFLPEDDVPF